MRRFWIRCASLAVASCAVFGGADAAASNPLEYPDNGGAAFSRAGAWVATASDPIAVHYNPAALAFQPSGASVDVNLSYNDVCFDRENPGGAAAGPRQESDADVEQGLQYRKACNGRDSFPTTIPSLAITWRATDRLGVGVAVVPPAAYGTANEEWPAFADGHNANPRLDEAQTVPAPYRFMTLGNQSTILFPTWSLGYELLEGFRLGAGFVSGIAVLNVSSASTQSVAANDVGDHAEDDARSFLETRDLFVPGVVFGLHWSVAPMIDVGLWGRWIDAIETTDADLTVIGAYYDDGLDAERPVCAQDDLFSVECQGLATRNEFSGDEFERFRLALPPEIRAGVRYHHPRSRAERRPGDSRDPLRDDVFDIELDATYSINSVTDRIEIRFPQLEGDVDGDGTDDTGEGLVPVAPVGRLPPNADRQTGYKDSIGVRLGGQVNVLADKLGVRAGSWVETPSADDEFLHVAPVPALRGGFGGGIVVRQDVVDFQLGYQHHWSAPMDNGGDGAVRGNAGVLRECAGVDCPPPGTPPEPPFQVGTEPADQQFRTFHAINGGRVTQSANVVTLGAIVRIE